MEYGSDQIDLYPRHILLPLLTSPSRNIKPKKLTHSITFRGHPNLLSSFEPNASINLYESHMDKLVQYMAIATRKGQFAEVAMHEIYDIMGLEEDDLSKDTAYKRFQRFCERKNKPKSATNHTFSVQQKLRPAEARPETCFATVASLISSDYDAFMTPEGRPVPSMLLKVVLYAMVDIHGWSQQRAATYLDKDKGRVSRHLSAFRSLIRAGVVLRSRA